MDFTLDPTFTKSERSHDIINEKLNILTSQIVKKDGKGTFKKFDITIILLVKHLHNVLNEKFNNKDLN